MSRFDFTPTPLPGLLLVERKALGDARGYLQRLWCQDEWQAVFGERRIAQVNHTYTASTATVRGLHFQRPPFDQAKLVRCVEGVVLDVAVDIRVGSPTYGQHVAVELSANNKRQLFIPRGFAHGFVVLSETAIIQYKVDNWYSPENDGGILWNDETLGIDWKIESHEVQLSGKDKTQPLLKELNNPFVYIK